MFRQMRRMGWIRQFFERASCDAEDHARIIMAMAGMHDIRPSVARELFAAYCHETPCADWRACGRRLMTTMAGISWMTEQIVKRETVTPPATSSAPR